MKRAIKFRGKRADNGEWVYGDLVENQGRFFIYHAKSESTIEDNDDGRIVVVAVEADSSTVGQYTGLKDKDGNEIYEGDVIADKDLSYEVFWCDSIASFFADTIDNFKLFVISDVNISGSVIGNIHDNPELLEGGERTNKL